MCRGVASQARSCNHSNSQYASVHVQCEPRALGRLFEIEHRPFQVLRETGIDCEDNDSHGVFVTQPETCFVSEREAVYHAALIGDDNGEANSLVRSSRSGGTNTIGIHFTSTGFRGSSVRIIGTTCAGGVWYPTGRWNNNIESSRHYCGSSPTTFYDSSSCNGSPHAIYSSAHSLGQMNNRASCVRYG